MKTLKEIDDKMRELSKKKTEANARELKRIDEDMELCRQCRLYLVLEPDHGLIMNLSVQIERKISILNGRYGEWAVVNGRLHSNPKQAFRTAMGIPRLERQLRALKYMTE